MVKRPVRRVRPGMLIPRASIMSAMISKSLGRTEVPRENTPMQKNNPTAPRLSVVTGEPLESILKEGLGIDPQEVEKLKALNSIGRVDFVLQVQQLNSQLIFQAGVFEASYVSAIVAHHQYWKNKDVAHFILSRLLLGSQSSQKSSGTA